MTDPQILPDGSAFFTMSFPLPADHWLYAADAEGFTGPPPMSFRMIDCPQRAEMADKLREAGRYAVRAATMRGQEMDFDPDALVQNLIVGFLGYHTEDGLGGEAWMDPAPIPPTHGWYAHSTERTSHDPD